HLLISTIHAVAVAAAAAAVAATLSLPGPAAAQVAEPACQACEKVQRQVGPGDAAPPPAYTRWLSAAPGPASMGLAFAGGKLWVVDRKAGAIFAVVPSTGAVERRLPSPCGEPGGVAAGDGKLWCTDVVESSVHAMDAGSGASVLKVESPCSYPGSLAWAGGRLFIVCPFKKQIAVTDPQDGTALRWLPAPHKRVSALGAGGGYLWAADRERDEIYQIDPEHGYVLNVLRAGSPYVTGLASDGDTVWAVDHLTDSLLSLDLDKVPATTVEAEKRERLFFTHTVRNSGPAVLGDVAIFIALPGRKETQEVLKVTPFPAGTSPAQVADASGQSYWRFSTPSLPPGEEATAGFQADVVLRKVRWFVDPRQVRPPAEIPADVKTRFLRDQSKYDLEHPKIKEKAAAIVGSEKNPYIAFLRIYHYVIDNMEYQIEGGWNAAPLLLERKTGSCSEYTILLVALLRAAGIPARYVGSVVLRGEDASVDLVFHRWAEVFIPGLGWLPVDANRGDVQWPAEQAEGVGLLDASFLITTEGGGDSEIIGWSYNSIARWKHMGQADVRERTAGEWEPLGQP
ncbi:MAG: hypothetical protein FJ125_09980, partial [Deltaproteobacteria bacterium]|nr:hypothetical protein [Deltaproteobacteria bacterium]